MNKFGYKEIDEQREMRSLSVLNPDEPRGQTKRGSSIEALFNILVGIGVAFGSQVVIFHFYMVPVTLWQQGQMTLWFTGVSLVRSYVIRRWFNFQTISGGKLQ